MENKGSEILYVESFNIQRGYLLATTIVLAYILVVIAIYNEPWNNFLDFIKLFLNKEGVILAIGGISYKASAGVLFYRRKIPLSICIIAIIEVFLLLINIAMIITLLIINPYNLLDYVSGIVILSIITFAMFSSAK